MDPLVRLARAIDALPNPSAVVGTKELAAPVVLAFRDGTRVSLHRRKRASRRDVEPLLERCAKARFGDGAETRYDDKVRRGLALRVRDDVRVEGFDPLSVVQAFVREVGLSSIEATLYAVNVYGRGDHFVPHKDTPAGPEMIGSLVVCVPYPFSGGALVVGTGDDEIVCDWSKQIAKQRTDNAVHWAAFYGDVDHRVEPVTSGYRITLNYRLFARAREGSAKASTELVELLKMASGRHLVIPCRHAYRLPSKPTESAIDSGSLEWLKGPDRQVAAAALELGYGVRLRPFLSISDLVWPLRRVPTRSEAARLPDRVTDDDFDVWIDPVARGFEMVRTQESDLGRYVATREFSPTGYFGNEGSEEEFYVIAALEIETERGPIGERVTHPKFGSGVIVRKLERDEPTLLVRFDDGAEKTLLAKFVKPRS